MRLLDVGHGARQVLRGSRCGVVHSVFSRAAYLQLEAGLVAVTDTAAPAGPLHLRALELPRHRPGDVVLVTAQALSVGPVTYDLNAPDWQPLLPSAAGLNSGSAILLDVTALLSAPDLSLGLEGEGRPRELSAKVVDAIRRGDLPALRRLVSGRGPGLTPSGDDLLAGILVVASCLWGEGGWPQINAAADGSATGNVAAAFLHWAARGSCIEPVPALLSAAAAGDRPSAVAALDRLVRIGASSGTDLAYGVRVAIRWLPRQPPPSGRGGRVDPQQVRRSSSRVRP